MGIIAIGVVAAAAGVAFAASRKPDDFRITRSATLKAPPEALFAYVNDFHKWTAWSPFEKLDPNLKRTYSGPEQGVGTAYEWSGNSQAGAGKMTITESAPSQRIVLDLVFSKPFAANNKTEFTFTPKDGGTEVSWSMSGTNNFIKKVFAVFMDMDKMLGPQFEEGLAKLGKAAGGGGAGDKQLPLES